MGPPKVESVIPKKEVRGNRRKKRHPGDKAGFQPLGGPRILWEAATPALEVWVECLPAKLPGKPSSQSPTAVCSTSFSPRWPKTTLSVSRIARGSSSPPKFTSWSCPPSQLPLSFLPHFPHICPKGEKMLKFVSKVQCETSLCIPILLLFNQ